MKDLGDRMKSYEDVYRSYLPGKQYVIVRVDGKAFRTYTKNAGKPFDSDISRAMSHAAYGLCEQVQGACFAYTQSDEISLLFTDFQSENADRWFAGNIQKQASVTASMATYYFNKAMESSDLNTKWSSPPPAFFDSRVFNLPTKEEVDNYFIWRFMDWRRNSVFMVARTVFSHKELMNKNHYVVKEMLKEAGHDWDNYSPREKYGSFIIPVQVKREVWVDDEVSTVIRHEWKLDLDPPNVLDNRDYIRNMIPDLPTKEQENENGNRDSQSLSNNGLEDSEDRNVGRTEDLLSNS